MKTHIMASLYTSLWLKNSIQLSLLLMFLAEKNVKISDFGVMLPHRLGGSHLCLPINANILLQSNNAADFESRVYEEFLTASMNQDRPDYQMMLSN